MSIIVLVLVIIFILRAPNLATLLICGALLYALGLLG